MEVDPGTHEIYIADGYLNKRVIVFDSDKGTFKRLWGAYGNPPNDADPGAYIRRCRRTSNSAIRFIASIFRGMAWSTFAIG